jgi:hypothetical protein
LARRGQLRHVRDALTHQLRLGAATVEAGILTKTGEFEGGDLLDISGSTEVVRAVEPVDGEPELKLIVDLLPGRAR